MRPHPRSAIPVRCTFASLLAVTLLAGCGGGDDGDSAAEVTAAAPVGATTMPAAGGSGALAATGGDSDLTLPPVAATSTIEVRLVHLLSVDRVTPGPTVDIVTRRTDDIGAYETVVSGLRYGEVSEPFTVPELMTGGVLWLVEQGTDPAEVADDPTGASITSVVVDADAELVVVFDGFSGAKYQTTDQLRPMEAPPSGQGFLAPQVLAWPAAADDVSWTLVIDGECQDTTSVLNTRGVPLDAGTYEVRVVDVGAANCSPSSPLVFEPVEVEITAGQTTVISPKGEALGVPMIAFELPPAP